MREHDSQETLQALSNKLFDNHQVQKESKQLLRMLLTRQLRGREFNTRSVYTQMLKSQSGKGTQK